MALEGPELEGQDPDQDPEAHMVHGSTALGVQEGLDLLGQDLQGGLGLHQGLHPMAGRSP